MDATGASNGPVSAADSRGNSYSVDADVTYANRVRTVILSAHAVTALAAGDLITVTSPSVNNRALTVNEFTGRLAPAPQDRASSFTDNNAAVSSGATAASTQADELLFGAAGIDGRLSDSFTAGADYTKLPAAGTDQGGVVKNISVKAEYQLVSSVGAYAATGALSASRRYAAAIVTYRLTGPLSTPPLRRA